MGDSFRSNLSINNRASASQASASQASASPASAGQAWVERLEERIEFNARRVSQRGSPVIYRVGSDWRGEKDPLFDATHVCLGLFQRERENQLDSLSGITEALKPDVVIKFLEDTQKTPQDWEDISLDVVPNPGEMSSLYDEHWHLDPELETIRTILAVDAIFLACFFLFYYSQSIPTVSPEGTTRFFMSLGVDRNVLIFYDVIKLENQIPLELVKNAIAVYLRGTTPGLTSMSLTESLSQANDICKTICCRFIKSWRHSLPSFQLVSTPGEDSQHLLHSVAQAFWDGTKAPINPETGCTSFVVKVHQFLMRELKNLHRSCCYRSGDPSVQLPISQRAGKRPRNFFLPTASKLYRHGIRFQGQEGFQPQFKQHAVWPWRATLLLPTIEGIHDETEMKWRNFLAFENRHLPQSDKVFLTYLMFMDALINTDEDVSTLSTGKNAVIQHNGLGNDKAVANLFNSMTKKYMMQDSEVWSSIEDKVEEYLNSRWRTCWSALGENFSQRPWLPITAAAAFLIFVLTLLQTVYSMITFYHSKS